MGKGILKRHEPIEVSEGTPDSCSKHVKWDEEKLKVSEAIKMTIPKGQIDEPKTPFQHGQYGSSCDESVDEGFKLKEDESEEGSLSDSSFRRASITSTGSSSVGWESSLSEFEETDEADTEEPQRKEAFKAMRAQHYFMKQALKRGKELIETDDEEEDLDIESEIEENEDVNE